MGKGGVGKNVAKIEVFTLPHLIRADSVQSVDSPQTVLRLHLDRVLVDVLLDEPSASELSPSQIRAESEDYTDTRNEHGRTPYGLCKAWSDRSLLIT
jgi:hypothetical protein